MSFEGRPQKFVVERVSEDGVRPRSHFPLADALRLGEQRRALPDFPRERVRGRRQGSRRAFGAPFW